MTTYRRHVTQADGHHHHEGMCIKFMSTHRWCEQPAREGMSLCTYHNRIRGRFLRRQEEARIRRDVITETIQEYTLRRPVMTWQAVARDVLNRHEEFDIVMRRAIAVRYFAANPGVHILAQFNMFWNWLRFDLPGPVPAVDVVPQERGLREIARDPQNVHTRQVSEQTNRSLELLLETQRRNPRNIRAPEWFAARWLIRSYGPWRHVAPIVNDMYLWYDRATCRTENDCLYRRALDGLYMRIVELSDKEAREEIIKRVFEECRESVGMCCDGHISRICNVLVGFDEAFLPPVPFGEILQNKMASIAGLDIPTEEKIQQAIAFFNEYAVPEADRAPWLEAF